MLFLVIFGFCCCFLIFFRFISQFLRLENIAKLKFCVFLCRKRTYSLFSYSFVLYHCEIILCVYSTVSETSCSFLSRSAFVIFSQSVVAFNTIFLLNHEMKFQVHHVNFPSIRHPESTEKRRIRHLIVNFNLMFNRSGYYVTSIILECKYTAHKTLIFTSVASEADRSIAAPWAVLCCIVA